MNDSRAIALKFGGLPAVVHKHFSSGEIFIMKFASGALADYLSILQIKNQAQTWQKKLVTGNPPKDPDRVGMAGRLPPNG
jgi:hypothetical protein